MGDLIDSYLIKIKDLLNKYYFVNEPLEFEVRIGTYTKTQIFKYGNTNYDPTNVDKFVSSVSKQYFEAFKDKLIGKKTNEKTLTFISENLRITKNLITKEMIYESKKRLVKFDMPNINMRLSISRETKKTKSDTKGEKFHLIRYKDRDSITIGNWRYDLSKVVQKDIDAGGIGLKHITNNIESEQPTSYEIEIEYIGKKKTDVIKDLENLFIENTVQHNDDDKLNEIKNLINSQRLFNNPITFLKYNIGDIEINNYAATEKADGERRLLYKDLKGFVYYITTADQVLQAPDLNMPKGTILDGEFINNGKFLSFDILAYNNKSTIKLPLEKRLNLLKEVKGDKKTYEMKKFYFSKQPLDIYDLNDKVLSSKYSYDIDGIILTPMKESYFNKNTFKWKDPSMTSTDFLVKNNLGSKTPWELYVGITGGLMKQLNIKLPEDFSMMFPDIDKDSNYYPILFKPKDLTQAYDLGFTEKQIKEYGIEDDIIIELVLTSIKNNKPVWEFVKIREDKTRAYKNLKNNFGNNWKTAESNLYAIINPVSKKIITGKEKSSFFTDSGKKSNIFAMRKFHTYIKSLTYKSFAEDADWLLEIGAGRFGDLIRWSDNKIKNIVALDVDEEAIKEGNKRLTVFKNDGSKVGNVYSGVYDLAVVEWNKVVKELVKPVKFDVIMINFAIHFFMSSESYIEMLIKNLEENTEKGSFIVISAMDGNRVIDLLSKTNKGEIYEIKKNNKTIFGLRKEYETNKLANFGQQISVYVESIGNYNNEYLVNFDYLKDKMKNNFNVYEEYEFKQIYPKWKKNKKKNIPDMTTVEKEYSYLWNVLIFEKK